MSSSYQEAALASEITRFVTEWDTKTTEAQFQAQNIERLSAKLPKLMKDKSELEEKAQDLRRRLQTAKTAFAEAEQRAAAARKHQAMIDKQEADKRLQDGLGAAYQQMKPVLADTATLLGQISQAGGKHADSYAHAKTKVQNLDSRAQADLERGRYPPKKPVEDPDYGQDDEY